MLVTTQNLCKHRLNSAGTFFVLWALNMCENSSEPCLSSFHTSAKLFRRKHSADKTLRGDADVPGNGFLMCLVKSFAKLVYVSPFFRPPGIPIVYILAAVPPYLVCYQHRAVIKIIARVVNPKTFALFRCGTTVSNFSPGAISSERSRLGAAASSIICLWTWKGARRSTTDCCNWICSGFGWVNLSVSKKAAIKQIGVAHETAIMELIDRHG